MRRFLMLLLAALVLLAPVTAASAAPKPKTTLADVEDEVMCVLCGTALNVADSAQADRERAPGRPRSGSVRLGATGRWPLATASSRVRLSARWATP